MKKVLLPSLLMEKIKNTTFPKGKTKNKSILFLKLIYTNYLKTGDLYKDMDQDYLQKTFGEKEYELTGFLKLNGFVDTYKFWTPQGYKEYLTSKHQCKKYCIVPELLIKNDLKIVEYGAFKKEMYEMDQFETWAYKDLKQITVDVKGAEQYIKQYINSIDVNESYKINEEIQEDTICLEGVYFKKEDALLKAQKLNLDLIRNKRNEFEIICRKEFIKKVKKHKLNSYQDSLYRLSNQILNSKRNKTNRRLDHNVTNINTELINFMDVDNQSIINIDLSNSQFCLLANLLSFLSSNSNTLECYKFVPLLSYKLPNFNKTKDLDLFIDLAQKGKLYLETAKLLNLKGTHKQIEKEAKGIWFQTAFASYKYSSPQKRELEKIFPVVMEWIQVFKKDNGSKNFSVMLQNIESNIFIDNIYLKVKELGYWCLTKHDSLLAKESNVDAVRTIMVDELNRMDIKHALKTDKPKKEIKPYVCTDTFIESAVTVKNNREPISSKDLKEANEWLNELYKLK